MTTPCGSSPEQLSNEVRAAMAIAHRLAQRLQHREADTAHMLYGLLDRPDTGAASALAAQRISVSMLRCELVAMLASMPRAEAAQPRLPWSALAADIPNRALALAKVLGYSAEPTSQPERKSVGTEHYLLAILEGTCPVAQLLRDAGVQIETVRSRMHDA